MKNKKLAIYIHIPFCIRKCFYCDFLSAPATEETQNAYVWMLCQEIQNYNIAQLYETAFCDSADRSEYDKESGLSKILKQNDEESFSVITVFFGGGTPSLISAQKIAQILDELHKKFSFSDQTEITMECNPGTVSKEKLEGYGKAGVNRISFGLQSANNEELKTLGRIHTWETFADSFSLARKAGFLNINIDLMSALPGQTEASYERTLKKVMALHPEHISSYSLIIEEGTPFYERYHLGKGLPDEDTERQMYERTKQILGQEGYERYEISNYSKKGYECRHNLCYWNGTDYIGFGLGASSMVSHIRYHNCSDFSKYMQNGANPKLLWEEINVLSKKEQMEEYMFLGLRCMEGVSVSLFEQKFGVTYDKIYGAATKKMQRLGLLAANQDRISLTEKGIDVSNYVLSEFLL